MGMPGGCGGSDPLFSAVAVQRSAVAAVEWHFPECCHQNHDRNLTVCGHDSVGAISPATLPVVCDNDVVVIANVDLFTPVAMLFSTCAKRLSEDFQLLEMRHASDDCQKTRYPAARFGTRRGRCVSQSRPRESRSLEGPRVDQVDDVGNIST